MSKKGGGGSSFTPPKGNPTPLFLRDVQQKWTAAKEPTPLKGGVPIEHPSAKPKATFFKVEDYKTLDNHAIKAPIHFYKERVNLLVQYLTEPCKTDLEKLRVCVRWIAAQNLDVIDEKTKADPDTSLWYLKGRKFLTRSYAELLQIMMDAAEVKCKTILGQTKDAKYDVGNSKTIIKGAWNVVLINGDWRPISVNWVCQGVKGVRAGHWRQLNTKAGKAEVEEEKVIYGKCDEDHFMPDPHQMIYTHFPDEKKYQMLARPLTEDEFKRVCYCRPPLFDHGLELNSHWECVLRSRLGKIEILLGVPAGQRKEFVYKLFISDVKVKDGKIDTKMPLADLTRYVYNEQVGNEYRTEVRFPVRGKYQLQLYVNDYAAGTPFLHACSYVINCKVPFLKCKPLPVNTRREWGPGHDSDANKMKPIPKYGGRVPAPEGEAEVYFETEPGVEYLTELTSNDHTPEELESFAVHRVENGKLGVHLKLPKSGEYGLKIFAKGKKDDSYKNVCNYLVDSDISALFPTPYPDLENGKFGIKAVPNKEIGLKPKNHEGSYHRPKKRCTMEFTTKIPADFSWRFNLQTEKGPKDMTNYCFLEYKNPTEPHFRFKFPRPGTYHFALYGKPAGADKKEKPKVLANYIFDVKDPDWEAFPFPRVGWGDWWRGCYRLVDPDDGLFKPNTNYNVVIEAPKDAKNLMIESEGGRGLTNLKKRSDGLWEGQLTTDANGGYDLKLVNREGGNPYLTFRVLTPAELQKHLDDAARARGDYEDLLRRRRQELEDAEAERRRLQAEMQRMEEMADRGEDPGDWEDPLEKERRLARERELAAMAEQEKARLDELRRKQGDLEVAKKERAEERKEEYLKMKQALEDAVEGTDYELLRDLIDAMDRNNFSERCPELMVRARLRLELLYKIWKLGLRVLKLEYNTLLELKRYNQPLKNIHETLQAGFLLLGDSEKKTGVWKNVQKLISPIEFLKRVRKYNIDTLHPEIWARVKEILEPQCRDSIAMCSAAAAAIYEWSQGIVEIREFDLGTQNPGPAKPSRQVEIFKTLAKEKEAKELAAQKKAERRATREAKEAAAAKEAAKEAAAKKKK